MPIVTVTLTDSPTTPVPDSYVEITDPWVNYGESVIIDIEETGAPGEFEKAAMLRFPIETLPKKADIRKATLKLYVLGNDETADHFLFKYLLSHWEELSIAVGNMPGRGDTFKDTVFPAAGNWVEVDITEAVKEWYKEKRPNFGFIIVPKQAGSDVLSLASKEENPPDHPPQLVVEYLINPVRKELIPER